MARLAGKYRIAFLNPLETCEHIEQYSGCSDNGRINVFMEQA